MILKILGAFIVVVSTYILGVYYSFKESYQIEDLEEFKKAFLILLSEIEFNLTPIGEAMKNISEKVGSPVNKILGTFANEVKNPKEENLYDMWKSILKENRTDTYLDNDDIVSLEDFGKILGYLDKNMQIGNIKMIVQYIEQKTENLKEKSSQNKKMYKSFGALGGLLVVVILI